MHVPGSPKVLVVGAGGIGCELLKNLVLDSFQDITVIDLDTIDISNLNRQFLFQRIHVGRSKAEVARESVLRFRPSCNISAFHKSILSSAFDVNFFSSFDLVFNALDNRAARRHVNRLCVAAKRPLIESGTAGYLGQVEPLLPTGFPASECDRNSCAADVSTTGFRTGCYECQPRGTAQRTYPACTIRNTPSEPIHCVVWAKYLFNQLFGEPDIDDEDVSPDMSDPELRQNRDDYVPKMDGHKNFGETVAANNLQIDQTIMNNAGTLRKWFQDLWKIQNNETVPFPSAVIALTWRLFHQDIVTLIGMRDLWVDRQDRREPTALDQTTLDYAVSKDFEYSSVVVRENAGGPDNLSELRDQRRLTKCGWLRMFMESVKALQLRLQQTNFAPLMWDKDDSDAMDFVAGASILRTQLFNLPGADDLTRFVIKSLAGNIIPAIATTNAIIAGLMVLQARQVLARTEKNIRTVYVQRFPTGRLGNRRLITPCDPVPSNPSCLVCSSEATKPPLGLLCSPSSLSLRILRDHILIKHLGMLAPDVEVEHRGIILISSEEGETDEDTLNKTLADFAVQDGVHLLCDDFRQDFQLRLVVSTDVLPDTQLSTNVSTNMLDMYDAVEGWRVVGDLSSLLKEARKNPVNKNCPVPPGDLHDSDEAAVSSEDEDSITKPCDRVTGDHFKRTRTEDPDLSYAENGISSPFAAKRPRPDVVNDHSNTVVQTVVDDDDDDIVCLD